MYVYVYPRAPFKLPIDLLCNTTLHIRLTTP